MRAFIAGGTGSIGSCIVKNFLELGFHCTIHGSEQKSFDKLKLKEFDENHYDFFPLRASEIYLKESRNKVESFDIFVNACGGAGNHQDWKATTLEKWNSIYLSNVLLPVFFLNYIILGMKEKRHGKVINIASISGVKALQIGPEYSAAKSALIKLSESLAKDCANSGVNVNCISPGLVLTDQLIAFLANKENNGKVLTPIELANLSSELFPNLIGALPSCQDIADLILFMTSEKSDKITGQNIIIDSGYSLSNYPIF